MQNEFKRGDIVQFKNALYHSLHGRMCEVIHVHRDQDGSLEGYGVKFFHKDNGNMYVRVNELYR